MTGAARRAEPALAAKISAPEVRQVAVTCAAPDIRRDTWVQLKML